MNFRLIAGFSKKTALTLTCLLAVFRCADEALTIDRKALVSAEDSYTTTAAGTTGAVAELIDCADCSYVIPEGQTVVDGTALGLTPGSIIGLNANIVYKNLTFRNIIGTPDQPIVIKNCGGTAQIDGTGTGFSLKTEGSKYFRITGGEVDNLYGIIINGGHMGISLGGLSTHFEVDHVEIKNSGFAGIIAKTDPGCDDATIRENFLMENVDIHHNYIHGTGGEGIYAGNSWYAGMSTACGTRLPHEIHNIRIFDNLLKNTGWEAIQLGCATKGASIYGNTIENYGTQNKNTQNNGIQIGAGTGGLCYNNLIRNGTGHGLILMGLGDNIIFNNIIDKAGNSGIFCDERETPGQGFVFLNNTIINPAVDGIRIYAELVPLNVMINNIIANPGSYSTYVYPRSGAEDAFVYKLSDDVKIEMANNYFTTDTSLLKIRNVAESNYALESSSPVIDKGADVSGYHDIITDFYHQARLSGAAYDIGAIEFQSGIAAPGNQAPVANAGPNQILAAPKNATQLYGSGTDSDGSIVSYAWTQYRGTPAVLTNATSATASISGLVEGQYYFRLTVTDDAGASHSDNVLVKVEPNLSPVANAGPNQIVSLPQTSIELGGSGTDADGRVVKYSWTQYGGAPVLISNANQPTATVSGLTSGIYYFRLTVEDDDGATHYDNMLLKVQPADEN